jgi:hypothetical protein
MPLRNTGEHSGMHMCVENIVANLSRSGRYSGLLNRIGDPVSPSFLFELLFANALEKSGVLLNYEVAVRSGAKTVDFVNDDGDGAHLCFELTSPEMGNELKREYASSKTESEGISTYSVQLSSNHDNEYLRPEALTLRMQEKLLDKVDKFPDPTDSVFSVIVVDCSAFHFGCFDGEDCRMVVFGKTSEPAFQEDWRGSQIRGILDPADDRRGAPEFRERITAVVFVPEKKVELLDQAFLVLNVSRSRNHLERFWSRCRAVSVLSNLKHVPPAQ